MEEQVRQDILNRKRKLRVLCAPANEGGCAYYRAISPYKKLEELHSDRIEVRWNKNPLGLDEKTGKWKENWQFEDMKWADVVFTQNLSNFGGNYTGASGGFSRIVSGEAVFVGNYSRDFAGNFSRVTSTRTRTSTTSTRTSSRDFIATFSRSFLGNYTVYFTVHKCCFNFISGFYLIYLGYHFIPMFSE